MKTDPKLNTENADTVDIDSFDAVSGAEVGYEFELKDVDGMTGTGVFLTVIGRHSDPCQKWLAKIVNAHTIEQHQAQKRGKVATPKSLEALQAQNIEGALVRAVGWRNVKQKFSAEVLKRALLRNPHWVEQITAESDDTGNFSKKPSTT